MVDWWMRRLRTIVLSLFLGLFGTSLGMPTGTFGTAHVPDMLIWGALFFLVGYLVFGVGSELLTVRGPRPHRRSDRRPRP